MTYPDDETYFNVKQNGHNNYYYRQAQAKKESS